MTGTKYLFTLLICLIVNTQATFSTSITDGKDVKEYVPRAFLQKDIPRVFHVAELQTNKGDEVLGGGGDEGPLEKGLWGKRELVKPMPPSHALKEVRDAPIEKGLWGKRSSLQLLRRQVPVKDSRRYTYEGSQLQRSAKRRAQYKKLTASEDEGPKVPEEESFSVLEKGLWGKRSGNLAARLDERERSLMDHLRQSDTLDTELARIIMEYMQ